MDLGSFLLSFLIDNSVGRIFLMTTRFWMKSAIRQIAPTTKIEWSRSPSIITGLAYPNMLLPLRIVSKTNMRLILDRIEAGVHFEGLYVGTVCWFEGDDRTIERKSDKDMTIEFVPPLQVFLANLTKCCLRNGLAKFSSSLGEVVVPFSTDLGKIDNFKYGVRIARDLLTPQ